MAEQLVSTDGVQLCVETFGDPAHPALLLISSLAAPMDWWDTGFCARLAAAGHHVVRYDHRDTGRSAFSPAGAPEYTGDDLVADALRVLDALGIGRAHVAGISSGGGIAQHLAAHHRERLLTLTLLATTAAGARRDRSSLPGPEPRVAETFAHPAPDPDWSDPAAAAEYLVAAERPFAGTLGFDEERVRGIARSVVERTRDLAAAAVNNWAVEESAHEFALADIQVPTLVLHGTADPLFPVAHGRALAAEIPGATFVPLEGMGHQVPPPQLWDVVVAAVAAHTRGR